MKKINISTPKYPNQFTFVDKENFEWLNQWKWRTHSKGYAIRMAGGRKNAHVIYMHRLINDTPDGFETDHINRNKLDNRKKNLRVCRICENSRARHKVLSASGYKGVYMQKDGRPRKYQSYITVNKKRTIVRAFYTAKEAAAAYNSAAIVFHKQFAVLNKI